MGCACHMSRSDTKQRINKLAKYTTQKSRNLTSQVRPIGHSGHFDVNQDFRPSWLVERLSSHFNWGISGATKICDCHLLNQWCPCSTNFPCFPLPACIGTALSSRSLAENRLLRIEWLEIRCTAARSVSGHPWRVTKAGAFCFLYKNLALRLPLAEPTPRIGQRWFYTLMDRFLVFF